MTKTYKRYDKVTREILDTIKVGDLVKVNDWKTPMRVRAVSENYFVMTSMVCGATMYAVCEKLPREAGNHNGMVQSMFHCGPDHWLFGAPLLHEDDIYKFENDDTNRRYLQLFEEGASQISERSGVAIRKLYVRECMEV